MICTYCHGLSLFSNCPCSAQEMTSGLQRACFFFFLNEPPPTEFSPLPLHAALPISDRRVADIAGWTAPDYASVNVSERGATELMRALLEAGVGIEAGVWSVEDADRLVATELADREIGRAHV